jgi:ureidoglycolate lyase|tara:strand:- start:1734 stop:2276 length:543 start_codon:yes stop_codon:yes gene_type:complete
MVESAVSEFMDDPNSKSMHRISPIPLDSQSFAAFGDVLEATGKHRIAINEGTTVRFHDLAKIDVEKDGGKPIVNIFRGTPYPFPLTIRMMEKHPFGSQLFMPLEPFEYLVAVAEAKQKVEVEDVVIFACSPKQGVNFRPGVWHHPLLVLSEKQDFLVIDRGGEGINLIEQELAVPIVIDL